MCVCALSCARVFAEADIDILCLQETKTKDDFFPAAALADVGWMHSVFRGENHTMVLLSSAS